MGIFAVCDLESEVQLLDKTRFDASKSFNSKDSQDISSITIKAGLDGTAIECFSSNKSDWFLDYMFDSLKIDVNSTNNYLIFNEGGSDITATLTSGSYTLAQYATELQTQLEAESLNAYTVTCSNNKFTISASSPVEFKASPVQAQSFLKLGVSNTSHTSDFVEYGKRIITVVATNPSGDTDTKYFYINAYSKDGDYLFSNDGDLIAHEPDIMKWVQDGRSSFNNIHRKSQKLVMNWIDEKGFVNSYGDKYLKRDIVDLNEVNVWATYMTLKIIFQGLSNAIDDIFDRKASIYSALEEGARQRVVLRLDVDQDGNADQSESISIYSGSLFRR